MSPSSTFLREGMVLSSEIWLTRLEVGESSLGELKRQNVLRKVPSDSRLLRLDFVGLISTAKRAFFSMPKVCTEMPTIKDVMRAVGCIQTYIKRQRNALVGTAGVNTFHEEAGRLLDLFLDLLNWSLENGLHRKEDRVSSTEFAHIDWSATLQRTFPAHQGNNVVYVSPEGMRVSQSLTALAEVQSAALLDLKARLGAMIEVWINPHAPVFEDCEELAQRSDASAMSLFRAREILEAAATDSMRDADQELIQILERWTHDCAGRAEHFQLFGSTAFHTIWEDACVSFLGGTNSAVEHGGIASQPVYDLLDGSSNAGPQNPDFLHSCGDEVWLADAKWYRASEGELPGLSDLVKQFVYEMSIQAPAKVRANCFLVPHVGGELVRRIGEASMASKGGRDDRFPSIAVLSLDWRAVSDSYRIGRPQERWREVLST